MFGWRKRNDGFEWRDYVRTTILVRRKNRRDRLEEAGAAVVDGLKVAGERGAAAGVAGAQALGRGAKAAGAAAGRGAAAGVEQGKVFGAAAARGAKAAGEKGVMAGAGALRAGAGKLREGTPGAIAALRSAARATLAFLVIAWDRLAATCMRLASAISSALAPAAGGAARRLEPVFIWLRDPGLSMPLRIMGGVALLGGLARGIVAGFDRDAIIALTLGAAVLGIMFVAHDPARSRAAVGALLNRLAPQGGRLGAGRPLAGVAGMAIGLAIIVGAGWLAWLGIAAVWNRVAAGNSIEGRAVALAGDKLKIGTTLVTLSGIEAPVSGQTCTMPNARSWRCDVAAKAALARLADAGPVACKLSGADSLGGRIASCRVGERDLGAELVRGGHVFSDTGLFSAYATLEAEARSAKRGVWIGEAERPADYRAHKWQDAKRSAPDGCPIKGEVKGGERLYVLPWSRNYAHARVSTGRGGRWFCSEEEAQAAGWKPSDRS
jgi:endonuclease YncB( thermonuclease family)